MPRKSRKTSQTGFMTQVIPQKTAIYARLSARDDICGQVELAKQFIATRPDLRLCAIFTDNGRTGTNFVRAGFADMMDAARTGEIDCIVVKDLSRLGRSYIEVSELAERILPSLGVRLIAINDGFDSNTTDDMLIMNLKNLINDIYARDISQKIIATLRIKQQHGDYIGGVPLYGYQRAADNRHKLVVDEEVAPHVRDIFDRKAAGQGDSVIARHLNNMGVASPIARRVSRGEVRSAGRTKLFIWRDKTIQTMTTNPMYIGHMTQGRQRQALCDGLKAARRPPCEWIIVENTHEAIVEKEIFDMAQNARRRT